MDHTNINDYVYYWQPKWFEATIDKWKLGRVVTKNEGPKYPTADTLSTTDPADLTLLINLSSSDSYSSSGTSHLLALLLICLWSKNWQTQQHIARHNAHFPQCLLTQMHQKYLHFIHKLYIHSDSTSIFLQHETTGLIVLKNVCCSSTSSYPSAVRTRLPIRRSGKSKT
jgi:hypothetical protein